MNKPAIQIIEFRIFLGLPLKKKEIRRLWTNVSDNVFNPAFSNKYCLGGMENTGWYNAAMIRFSEPPEAFEDECERLRSQGFQAGTMTELAAMNPGMMNAERNQIFAPGETSKGGSLNEKWIPQALLSELGDHSYLSWSPVDHNTLQYPI